MKISIIGTGYVGLVTGACFAEMGNTVTCIDINQEKINLLKKSISPIYEPGLDSLLSVNSQANRLLFSTNYESVRSAKVVFIAVGTPSKPNGSADLRYLFSAIEKCIPFLQENSILVLKSTVPIGTSSDVKAYLKQETDKRIHVVNNPEFLKEGSAIQDFMKPERVILGTENDEAFKVLADLYAPFMLQKSRTIRMSNLSAEMTKYAANCFLATKISFINEIAKLCDLTGADIDEVRSGISTDSRIGSQFLYPGPGYGGSCFPKDVNALIYTAKQHDLDLEIINATESVNKKQKLYLFDKITKHFSGQIKGRTFAIWGVAFKANTDDIRESAAEYITEALSSAGAQVKFYDPVASTNFEKLVKENNWKATKSPNKYDCLNQVDGLIILTEWKEFRTPDFDEMKYRMKQHIIFDGRNLYNAQSVLEQNIHYYAVGKAILTNL